MKPEPDQFTLLVFFVSLIFGTITYFYLDRKGVSIDILYGFFLTLMISDILLVLIYTHYWQKTNP
jgi:hypothetical protein